MGVWERRIGSRGDDRREWESVAAAFPQRGLQESCDLQFGHSRSDARERAFERALRDRDRVANMSELLVILPLTQNLDEIDRWPPLPSRSRLQQPLKIAVHEMDGFKTRDLDMGQLGKTLPESNPQALRFDDDAREVADFVSRLRLISEISDEQRLARGHEEERAGPGKSTEAANVGGSAHQEPVEMRRDDRVRERRETPHAMVNHGT